MESFSSLGLRLKVLRRVRESTASWSLLVLRAVMVPPSWHSQPPELGKSPMSSNGPGRLTWLDFFFSWSLIFPKSMSMCLVLILRGHFFSGSLWLRLPSFLVATGVSGAMNLKPCLVYNFVWILLDKIRNYSTVQVITLNKIIKLGYYSYRISIMTT